MTYKPGQNHSNVADVTMTWDQELATELVLSSEMLFRRDDCLSYSVT